jgi:hypothetical protein
MKLTLSGKEFTLRCDMRALANAKKEAGIVLEKLQEENDLVTVGTLVYFMAQSGAKYAGIPFKYTQDDFLGLIELEDLPALSNALGAIMSVGQEKKSKG